MEQVQVEITGLVSTNRYGNMSPGTILRTDAAFAKHLVEEAGAAKYCQVAPVVEAPVVEAPVVEAPVVEAPVVEAPMKRRIVKK